MRTKGLFLALALLATVAPAQEPGRRPFAVLDLATEEGRKALRAEWRYADARIVEADFRAPGPDRKPSGPPNRTYDVEPKAGGRDFDDSRWEVVEDLSARRSTGRVCFGWYRLRLTVPEEAKGSTVVFEIHVDDYAEVWVDGVLRRELGGAGGPMVAGFNVPNRVVLARDAVPGTAIQVAVLGINGPISDPPANYVWVRGAKLELHRPPKAPRIERMDARFDAVVPPDATVEKVAGGFTWVEGPVWDPKGFRLLFSDIPRNAVLAWREGAGAELLLAPAGYTGTAPFAGREPGSNGLALDAEGRLLLCQHGDRRIARLEGERFAVVADRYRGRRLNSPNDLAFGPNGDLYFTDPPFGLPGTFTDPARELDHCGVYRVDPKGEVSLLTTALSAPNGLCFSPDGKTLYVSNADPARAVWMAFPVREDGALGDGRVFADATAWARERPGAPDGMKCDVSGNLFAAGPGGLYVFASDGTHLGTIVLGVPTSNCAFGASGTDLYITADTSIYRLRWPRVAPAAPPRIGG